MKIEKSIDWQDTALDVAAFGDMSNSGVQIAYDDCGRLAAMEIFSFRENPCQSVDNTSPRLYTHDGNKNVSEAVAATSGEDSDAELLAHYDYAAFGAVVAQKGDCAEVNPWRFSSEYEDTELGLVYYNYRHYEPVMGRWLARDPIGEKGGFNLHGLARIVGKRPTALTERPTAFNTEGAEVGRHGECGKVLDRIDKIDRIVERGVSRLANPVNPVNPVKKTPCLLSSVSSALSESNAPVAYSARISFRENPCQSVGKTSPRFYTHDGNKNVSEVVAAVSDTNATVEVVAHYDYAAFGAVIAQKGDCAESNPWRFSSEYEDTELGLDYYNYRHYDPMTGRWLQRDPMEEAGGANLYGFCKNSPCLLVDVGGCSLADYMPFWSTILSMINNFLGHIPGSSPIDYPFVSPRECACNGEAAEKACLVEVDKMALKYIADYAASAAVARVIDLIVAILSIHLNPSVAAAFSADGMIGLALNAKAAAEIMEGANKAKQNNCSCSQYEH